jgi:hypothetical protein
MTTATTTTIIITTTIIKTTIITTTIIITITAATIMTCRLFFSSTFKTVAVLFPLLGITWIFGLLLFATQEIMFQYLFAVFNSLQVRH